MLKKCFFFLLFIQALTCKAQFSSYTKTFGGNNNFLIFSLDTVHDGGYILVGSDYGFNGANFTIIKTDVDGNEQWRYENNQFNGNYFDNHLFKIKETPDHGFIAIGDITVSSTNYNDALIVKLDSLGSLKWNKQFNLGNYEKLTSIKTLDDTTYLITGHSDGYAIIYKINNLGDSIWTSKLPRYGGSISKPFDIIKTKSNYYVCGVGDSSVYFTQIFKLDSSCNFIWQKNISDTATVYSGDTYYWLTADSFLINISLMHGFQQPLGQGYYNKLLKFDLDGNIIQQSLPSYYGKFDTDSTIITLYDGKFIQDSLNIGRFNFNNGTYKNYQRLLIPNHNIGDRISDSNNNILVCGRQGAFGGIGFLAKIVDTLNIGVAELKSKYSISIFPNPATDRIIFNVKNIPVKGNLSIEAYNILGEQVLKCKKSESLFQIDLNEFKKGIYLFNIFCDEKKIASRKVIIN